MTSVRFYVDAWDPSYGAALEVDEAAPTVESSAQICLDVEVPAASWRPLTPPGDLRPPDRVLLVDGVRRIDARVWVEEPDGTLHPGVAASYAAGVVACDLRRGGAEVVAARVARGLFTSSPDATELAAVNARYPVCRVATSDPARLPLEIQPFLYRLEAELSTQARETAGLGDDLLVVDGPLRDRTSLPRALGYIKTHRTSYLPADLSTMVGQLRPGERSPVFLLGTRWHRYSWYIRLPGPAGAPWTGVVRAEASADLPRGDVTRLADLSAATLPHLASSAYKDPRAPQNLTPIAGLERRLRSMLGDQRLLVRSLMRATQRVAA